MVRKKGLDLSVISPVYNEDRNLPLFYKKLKNELGKLVLSYEIIFVNDGSSDRSSQVLQLLSDKDKSVKMIEFARNFGQTAAISAGVRSAQGKVIVLMDSDLQNDPKDIKKLLEKLQEGFDLVSGWRKNRKDPFLTRTFPSTVANKIVSLVTGVKLNDHGCTLKAYKDEIIKKMNLYGEMHRLIAAYAVLNGAKIAEIPVSHHPRKFGKSKYNFWRVIKLLFDLLTVKFLNDFSTKPLYLFGAGGILVFLLGIIIFIFVTVRVVFFQGSWISPMILLAGLLVVLSFQFVLIGLLAEILVRIYFESQKNPPYVVTRKLNF